MLFRSQKDYRWWSSFLTYFIPLALATIGILTLFAWFDNRHQIDLLKSQAVAKHILLQQRMGQNLGQAKADLLTLA
jgi:hypothetical protein